MALHHLGDLLPERASGELRLTVPRRDRDLANVLLVLLEKLKPRAAVLALRRDDGQGHRLGSRLRVHLRLLDERFVAAERDLLDAEDARALGIGTCGDTR